VANFQKVRIIRERKPERKESNSYFWVRGWVRVECVIWCARVTLRADTGFGLGPGLVL